MSQAQLEKKVEDYLRKSQALEDQWQRPLTAEQLQAAMDRMAKQTRQPEVLHELFEALGNDAFVIAECLARPVLTERLVGDLSAPDNKERFDSTRSAGLRSVSMETTVANGPYTLPRIAKGILHARTITGHPPASPTRPMAESTTAQFGPALK